ncbi:MAG: hypothetical protein KME40_34240 [Komarekiella atlantica HA4396-MV6]|nr:hypothetical protein [Komarekiella atlantica HA4396-MV6]
MGIGDWVLGSYCEQSRLRRKASGVIGKKLEEFQSLFRSPSNSWGDCLCHAFAALSNQYLVPSSD